MPSVRRRTTGLVLCLVASSAAFIYLSAAAQRRAPPGQERDPPTPIREGIVAEKQKKHGKLYKGSAWYTKGRKVKDAIAEQGDVEIYAPLLDPIRKPAPPLTDFLRKQTCAADLVVIGVVMDKASQLTEDGSFIFTDYEIAVGEVLKNNQAAEVNEGGDITVTRYGGAVELNGHVARATDPSMGPLKTGESYLLYLKFLHETGAYRPFGGGLAEDTFRIQGEKVEQVSRKLWPFGQRATGDAAPFLREARNALDGQCAN